MLCLPCVLGSSVFGGTHIWKLFATQAIFLITNSLRSSCFPPEWIPPDLYLPISCNHTTPCPVRPVSNFPSPDVCWRGLGGREGVVSSTPKVVQVGRTIGRSRNNKQRSERVREQGFLTKKVNAKPCLPPHGAHSFNWPLVFVDPRFWLFSTHSCPRFFGRKCGVRGCLPLWLFALNLPPMMVYGSAVKPSYYFRVAGGPEAHGRQVTRWSQARLAR